MVTQKVAEPRIIIISAEHNDPNIIFVLDWLVCKKFEIIVSDNLIFEFKKFILTEDDNCEFELNVNGYACYFSNIKSYWFRNGKFKIDHPLLQNISTYNDFTYHKNYLNTEFASLSLSLSSLLDQQLFHVKSLNNSGNIFTDKLLILTLALNFGFKVPKTIVTSVKSDLFSFFKIQDRIITKPINSGKLVNEKMEFWAPAKEVKVGLLPNEFLPSLFQEYIDKALDIRVFILGAKVYSTAIFSQNSELTEVDFRTNTEGQINKIVPFKLPIKITKLLLKLMKSLKLTSGVVDLLYKDNEFIFLEINPSGQFSDISNSCNFYLEKEIAKFLCQEIN